MHHPGRVLQVETLAQEVGRDQDVGLERGDGWRRALRQRRERRQHLGPARSLGPEQAGVSHDRRDAKSPQPPQQVPHRGARLHEYDGLARMPGEQALEESGLGVRCAVCEFAEATHDVAVPPERDPGPRLQEQREQRQLQLLAVGAREPALELPPREGATLDARVPRKIEERFVASHTGAKRRQARRQAG